MVSSLPPLQQIRIGIISPLSIELAAVQDTLDEEYEDVARAFPNDPNLYTLGRIGKHHVVVASLPSGINGMLAPNDVAGNLTRTFPYVKALLLVGIGGGVPNTEHDIRMGDVVVSQPLGTHAGVVYYNHGKSREGGRFEPTGFQRPPPLNLLSALTNLKAQHFRDKTNLPSYVAKFQKKTGIQCIERADRIGHDVNGVPIPQIHYGLIASADRLMTDSMLRDQLNESYSGQILCFEMEAAGLMPSYPCLVVRGICDYSDSHKREDDGWQGFAAAMAAAYAKEFINQLPAAAMAEDPTIANTVKQPRFICPYLENAAFIGRLSIKEEIAQKLQHYEDGTETTKHSPQIGKAAALYGLGGVGKTQIAIAYIYKIHRLFPDMSIFCIHAATVNRFRHGYLEIGRQCQIPGIDDPQADVLECVKDWLQDEKNGRWLLVIDNADNIDDFFHSGQDHSCRPPSPASGTRPKRLGAYLPSCSHGSILVTTRNKAAAIKVASKKAAIEVAKMNESESQDLFSSILTDHDHSQSDMIRLASLLDHIPLALAQAAAYIEENSSTIARYIEVFNESEESALRLLSQRFEIKGREFDVPNAVAISWMLSFEQIRVSDPRAADMLSMMAFFDRQAIPESLLMDQDETRFSFDQSIGQLLAYSLITRNATKTQFDVHRLVHFISRVWQAEHGRAEKWRTAAQKRILDRLPKEEFKFLDVTASYLPHARAAIKEDMRSSRINYNSVVDLLMRYMQLYLQDRVPPSEFAEFATQHLNYCERHLGNEHQNTFAAKLHAAGAYQSQGRWKEAEILLTQAIRTAKRVVGRMYPIISIFEIRLVALYLEQGRRMEAESLDMEVEKRSQDDLILNACRLENVAASEERDGRWEEANSLRLQIFKVRKEYFGEDHPDTLACRQALAQTYVILGRFEEAELLIVQVLKTRKELLGEDHSETLMSMNVLSLIYIKQGRCEEAENLCLHAIEKTKRVQGEEDARTLVIMEGLGLMHYSQGRFLESLHLHQHVLDIRRKVLGADDPATERSVGWVEKLMALTRMNGGDADYAGFLVKRVNRKARRDHSQNTTIDTAPCYPYPLQSTPLLQKAKKTKKIKANYTLRNQRDSFGAGSLFPIFPLTKK
ncbi:MAG: hypothetical protein M1818_005770 [Claussenomyces sp. TS43310]|nr:MAG: hypothetical protein M1818_005770 [Claussenomyces sp. TS43310]